MAATPATELTLLRLHDKKIVTATTAVACLSQVRVATSFYSRCIGLIGRRRLGDDEGLLLAPGGSVHTLWMRFAVDVVFLDGRGTVLKVVSDVAPWRIVFAPPRARHVLELNACRSVECGIVAGRTILFE